MGDFQYMWHFFVMNFFGFSKNLIPTKFQLIFPASIMVVSKMSLADFFLSIFLKYNNSTNSILYIKIVVMVINLNNELGIHQ